MPSSRHDTDPRKSVLSHATVSPAMQSFRAFSAGLGDPCDAAGTGQSLHPVRLPSQCGSTETQSVPGPNDFADLTISLYPHFRGEPPEVEPTLKI